MRLPTPEKTSKKSTSRRALAEDLQKSSFSSSGSASRHKSINHPESPKNKEAGMAGMVHNREPLQEFEQLNVTAIQETKQHAKNEAARIAKENGYGHS